LTDLAAWGTFAGFVGSLIDSLLGATVQRTRYDKTKKLILQDDSAERSSTTVISGLNLLTNNQVNLVSSLITAAVVAYLA